MGLMLNGIFTTDMYTAYLKDFPQKSVAIWNLISLKYLYQNNKHFILL